MNLGEMKKRLALRVRDAGLAVFFRDYINDAILELAADFDFPSLQTLDPYPLPTNSQNWRYSLPENYHKRIFRALNSTGRKVWVYDRQEELERLDYDHDNTGDSITHIAANDSGDDKYLYTYPMADDVVRIWYYQRPPLLVKDADVCKFIPGEFHERVIFPKVIIRNFEVLMDQMENFDGKPLAYWEGRLAAGINGSRSMGPGLINWIAKLRGGPRRRGGRDPVGVGDYTRW